MLLMLASVVCDDAAASVIVAAVLCKAQLAPDVPPAQLQHHTTAADSARGTGSCFVQF